MIRPGNSGPTYVMKKQNKKGFSLIEIIVAVVVISILVAFAAFNLGGSKERANEARIQNDIEVIALAEEKYYADHSSWSGANNPINKGNVKTYCSTMKAYISRCPDVPHDDGAYTITKDKQNFNVSYASSKNKISISRK